MITNIRRQLHFVATVNFISLSETMKQFQNCDGREFSNQLVSDWKIARNNRFFDAFKDDKWAECGREESIEIK